MKEALIFSKVMTIIGLLLVLVILMDYLLPISEVRTVVTNKKRGVEYSKGKRYYTHNLIMTEENYPFPIFKDDYHQFDLSDTIVIAKSSLLHKHTEIRNISNSFYSIPSMGIYSYFSIVVAALLFSILMGLWYWNNVYKHLSAMVFTLFLSAGALYLIMAYH